MKTLGILGGMGPQAGLRFCEYLIACSIDRHGARYNADFPHFLLESLPVSDLIADKSEEERTVAMVEEAAARLAHAGADILVMACNTMHLYAQRIAEAGGVSFLSVVDSVVTHVLEKGMQTVGIVGSATAMRSGLYQIPLRAAGVRFLLPPPEEDATIVDCIKRIIAGQSTIRDRTAIEQILERLSDRGAETVVLACTELPMLMADSHSDVPYINSLRVLTEVASDALYVTHTPSPDASRRVQKG